MGHFGVARRNRKLRNLNLFKTTVLTKEFLFNWLWVLAPDEEYIIYNYYINTSDIKKTEMADYLGIHYHQIPRLETRALNRLRWIKEMITSGMFLSKDRERLYWDVFSGTYDDRKTYWLVGDKTTKFKKEQVLTL